MKKLTKSVLAVVLTASFTVSYAQKSKMKVDTAGTKDIEGVVVTALGIKRSEKSLSYAAQSVKSKELNLTNSVDVKGAIAGKVAGVQINGQAGAKLGETGKIRLRGAISLLNDADPIYVLEGVIVDPDTIDMENVDSVTVLKGPNATALYGQRGQYGVVVMTLKKGSRSRVNVEVNSNVNVDYIARTMKYQNEYGGGAQGEASMAIFHYVPGVHPDSWSVFDGKWYVTGDNAYTDASWGAKMDGREYVPWYAWWKDSAEYGKTASYVAHPDNVKDFYNKALTLKNSISVSGGNDFFTGRISFSNVDQNGVTPYTYFKGNYLTYNGSIKFNDRLNVETMFNFNSRKVRGEMDDTYGNQTTGSFNSWFNRDLDVRKFKKYQNLKTDDGYSASWNWWGPDYYDSHDVVTSRPAFWLNPYYYMANFDDTTRKNNYSLSIAPTYKITNDLSVRVNYSRTDNTSTRQYFMPYSISNNASGMIGGFMNFTNGFGLVNNRKTEDQYDARLSYSKKISKFDINANAGANIIVQKWLNQSMTMDVWGKTQTLLIPDVYTFSNSNVRINPVLQSYNKTYKSLYGTLSVGYNDLFYIDLSARNDINSAYFSTDNSFFTYSAGASLLVHNFLPKNTTLTYFKLRAGYAKVPSDISVGDLYASYTYGASTINGNVYAYLPLRYIDKNLKPAINDNLDAGIDLKFFNNRLSFSGTYYDENKNDEPIPVTAPASSGYTSMYINSGVVNRKGVELSLSGEVIKTQDFVWSTSLNFAKNKTMIKKVADGVQAIDFGSADDYSLAKVVMKEGYEWGQLVANGYSYDANGNKILNSDGTYAIEVGKNFGSVLPEFTGGFFNSFTYKNFTLSAAIDFQKGGKFFSLDEMWADNSGLTPRTVANGIRENGVNVSGVDAGGQAVNANIDAYSYFQQFYGNGLMEDYIHSASYIKLREVAFSYQISSKAFKGTGIQGMTFGVYMRNPWLISVSKDNIHKVDPSELSNTFGQNAQLPSIKSIGVNVKLNF